MGSCYIRFHGYDARANRGLIRWDLFLHPEVREVELTARTDTLRVVYRGEPAPAAWAVTLKAGGFPTPEVLGPSTPAIRHEPRDTPA